MSGHTWSGGGGHYSLDRELPGVSYLVASLKFHSGTWCLFFFLLIHTYKTLPGCLLLVYFYIINV